MIHRDDRLALLEAALRGRVSRRDLVRRAGALGLGTAGVAALLRAMPTSARRQEGTPAAGQACSGAITWALESDQVNLIPYGGVSGSNMWGKELMYDSL